MGDFATWRLSDFAFAVACALLIVGGCGGDEENRAAVVAIATAMAEEEAKCIADVEDLSWAAGSVEQYRSEILDASKDHLSYAFSTTGFSLVVSELSYYYTNIRIEAVDLKAKQNLDVEWENIKSGSYRNEGATFETVNQVASNSDRVGLSYSSLPRQRSCRSSGSFDFVSGEYDAYVSGACGCGVHDWPRRTFSWKDDSRALSLTAEWHDYKWTFKACNESCYEWTAEQKQANALMAPLLGEPDLYRSYQKLLSTE